MKKEKEIIFSAIKATGKMHIGNYLGAVKNWVDLQNNEELDPIFAIADLHSITIDISPEELRKNIFEMVVDVLACGVDPEKAIFFIQSHVKEHAELAWIFDCLLPVVELEKMTQYKDKAKVHKQNVNMGLFNYPALMAADILLYKATVVPVGDDQDQHVELTRKVVRKFNSRWGQYFVEPKSYLTKIPRLMALNHPDKKMSKEIGPKSYIGMGDGPEDIRKKIKSAVSGDEGGQNLVNLLEAFSDDSSLVEKFKQELESGDIRFGDLKEVLAETIISVLAPIQERRKKLAADREYIEKVMKDGAEKAQKIATQNMKEIKEMIGFI
jgi:tryptophanyl-tRNA synthetase